MPLSAGRRMLTSNWRNLRAQGERHARKRPPMASQPEVLNIGEAAALLRISKDALYNLAAAKKVPARKMGHQWRFSRSALLKYIGVPEPKKAVSE